MINIRKVTHVAHVDNLKVKLHNAQSNVVGQRICYRPIILGRSRFGHTLYIDLYSSKNDNTILFIGNFKVAQNTKMEK